MYLNSLNRQSITRTNIKRQTKDKKQCYNTEKVTIKGATFPSLRRIPKLISDNDKSSCSEIY